MNTAILGAFANHCDRHPLDRRPTIFVRFTDIWGDDLGEIGIPDISTERMTHATFAALAPWALIPTMQSAWLVVDWLEELRVINLKANPRGYFEPCWSVPYTLADDGTLEFGEPQDSLMWDELGVAVQGIKRVRAKQTLWKAEHTFGSVLPVVEELLHR